MSKYVFDPDVVHECALPCIGKPKPEMFDKLRFDLNMVIAGEGGEFVTLVYESPMTTKDGHETTISSMEIFRVVDGRIVEVWNCGYKQGVWQ